MAIEVDDQFLDRVEAVTRQFGSDIVSSPQGTLSGLVVKGGSERFKLGTTITGQVSTVTTALSSMLTALGTTAGTRAAQIALYQATADEADSLNHETIQQFLSAVPGWTQTGTGSPNPGAAPPPVNP